MRADFLPFFSPSIGTEEIDEVVDTLRSNWLTTGPKTHCFEEQFAEYVHAPAALALSSCTAGLHLALICLGVGPGDEVVTTPLTFAASANVIEHVGATPVLADIEPDTLTIDPREVERVVTERTKLILPVHYAGHPVDLDGLDAVTERYGLQVLEDAAHAIGASYRGRPIGSGDHPTSFSFYATKNLTTGEGGMLTGDVDLLERARVLSLHGLSRDAWNRFQRPGAWFYEVHQPGFKYNMTDLQASLGIWQLRKLAANGQRRTQIVEQYQRAFRQLPQLETPACRGDIEHAWHMYVLRLKPGALRIGRDAFIEQLNDRQIGTSVHFVPIHMHPYYSSKYGYRPDDFPVARDSYERMFSLPLHPGLSDEDVADVIDAVCDVIASNRMLLAA